MRFTGAKCVLPFDWGAFANLAEQCQWPNGLVRVSLCKMYTLDDIIEQTLYFCSCWVLFTSREKMGVHCPSNIRVIFRL